MADDRTDPQYKLRLPADLKERIEAAARAANRSMNAEIISRLEVSFQAPSSDQVASNNYLASIDASIKQQAQSAIRFQKELLDFVYLERRERIRRDLLIEQAMREVGKDPADTEAGRKQSNEILARGLAALEEQEKADRERDDKLLKILDDRWPNGPPHASEPAASIEQPRTVRGLLKDESALVGPRVEGQGEPADPSKRRRGRTIELD